METIKKRVLFSDLVKYFDNKEALVITGMRQVGKTTLMHQVFDWAQGQAKLWLDFENPLDVKLFEDIDYNNIYRNLEKMAKKPDGSRLVIFIDEIQIYPEATKVIKYLIDHYQVKFIVTGSSNYYLKNLFPESLSGRKFLFELSTLSFQEYLYFKDRVEEKEAIANNILQVLKRSNVFNHKKFEADYDDFVHYGGFPAAVLESNLDAKKQILKNIFSSFFEKDLKILSDYKDIQELRDLLLLLSPRVGSLLDVTRLAAELGVNRPKIYHYLEFLQGTFVIKLLPRFTKSVDKVVAGGKKVYFSDTGLLQVMGGANDAQLFENAVINQLFQYGKVSFYNKRNVAEIDAVLDKKIAFEIKSTGTLQDILKLQKLAADINIPEQYVISKKFIEGADFISPVIL